MYMTRLRKALFHRLLLLLYSTFLLFWTSPLSAADKDWKVTQEVLDNGLTVLMLEDHRAPVVTVQVWYKVGSRNERPGITGISHLLEHLMFRGTPKYGHGEFSRLVQEKGGSHNAFTSDDQTVYFENTASAHLDLLLELEADRMVNLTLDDTGFAAEKKIVMEERRMRTADEPAADLYEQLSAAAFTAHPYGWPTVGWMSDLETMTLEDVKNYRQVFYAPANAILVVAGDITPNALLPKVQSTFGAIPTGPTTPKVTSQEPPQRGERRVTLKRPASLPVYVAGYHTPNYKSEDSFPLSLLSVVLAGGRSSRLQTVLVENKALSLTADADYDRTSQDPSLFTLSMRVAPGKSWKDAEAALYQEVEKLKNHLVSTKELERAKNLVESSFSYGQDSLFYRAMQIGEYAALGDWSLIQKVIPNIRAVTAEDLQRVAKTYLTEENRTVGLLIPEGAPMQEAPGSGLGRGTVH
jgi:zinc protease